MSRSTSQASTATTTAGNGLSRSLSVKTNTKAQPLNPLPASDVKLFVTNLRLLDLDLREDWPDISVQTFSAKNADQKQRIGGTEWALFRLFEIWDPNETAQKLQPFFPPLEPLQSLNLRAALYRCLNELKKNGQLGRETVLRKTMLDECKGEKFYEILAVFSNSVLKKVVAARERNARDAAIARKLALAPTLSADQQRSLLPLAIAHKTALQNVLKRKEEKRRQYKEFERLLEAKADDIDRRIRKTLDTPRARRSAVPQKESDAVKKQLKDNWIGDPKWLDVMLHGDNIQTGDAFLGSRFDKVWRMVEAGRKLEDVVPEAGLLENLQSRVQEQQERLQQWRTFHQRLQKEKSASIPATNEVPLTVKEYKFYDHLQYQLSTSKRKEPAAKNVQHSALRLEYQDLLAEMDSELLRVSTTKPQRAAVLQTRRRRSSASARSPARSRKNTRSESIPKVPVSPVRTTRPAQTMRNPSWEKAPVLLPSRRVPTMATPTDSDVTLVGLPSTMRTVAQVSPPITQIESNQQPENEYDATPLTSNSPEEVSSSPPVHVDGPSQQTRYSSPPETSSTYPSEPPIPVQEMAELNEEDALAEQIIVSIGNATPSPVKKPQPRMSMSLMERTRMSMARTTSFEPVLESPLPEPSPQLPEPPTIEEEPDRGATLLERTRLSMMAMQSKPRMSMAACEKKEKRKSRQSLFPVNQFDTPRTRKSFELIEESISKDPERTPKEALFSDEIDYDRVFKSRPRIATSPIFSPEQIGNEEEYGSDEDVDGVTGIDLGDVDQDEDEDGFTKSWADSPSRRGGKIRV
ncbi:HAUS augmin-like complex subunit 6 N-terminus-domain-containing protein [Paraphoma chrysanthemicola]|nr:HAUS augmin-like complex subunit 6 N-terminus-domain-containing protein [Paraphoma chrysanthemicola]